MDKLIICKTDKGRYAVRPISWAGIWNEKGQIQEALNHLALFIEKEDAEKFVEWKETEEQKKLLKLPCSTVWFICDKKTATVMPKSIEYLAVYEIDGIDKRGNYWSTRSKALAALKEL